MAMTSFFLSETVIPLLLALNVFKGSTTDPWKEPVPLPKTVLPLVCFERFLRRLFVFAQEGEEVPDGRAWLMVTVRKAETVFPT